MSKLKLTLLLILLTSLLLLLLIIVYIDVSKPVSEQRYCHDCGY